MGQMKSYPSFDAYLKDQPATNQAVIRALRKLVARAAPSLAEAVKYGNGCWVQGKYPIAYVYAADGYTQFGFMAGSKLNDPRRLLEGSGAYVRHVKLRAPRDIVVRDLVALLSQAVALGHPAAKKQAPAKPSAAAARIAKAPDGEKQLAACFARHTPRIARLGKALRARLLERLPGMNELVYVYEKQDTLLIAYSPNHRGHDSICSIGLHPEEVRLGFARGAELARSAPKGLLQGSGKTVRYAVVTKPADLDRADIEALVSAAVKLAKVRLVAGAKGMLMLKE